jgi:hypothetical protein
MTRTKRFSLAGLALLGLLFWIPAAAATPTVGGVGTVGSSSLPKVDIKGSPAVFAPTKLSVAPHWNGTSTCTASVESFTLDNTTSASQGVTLEGQFLGTLGAHAKSGICINTDQAGKTDTIGLTSNKKAKLSVEVT